MNNVNTSVGNTSVGEMEYTLYGKPTIREILRGLTFQISANSFFQTNTRQVYDRKRKLAALPVFPFTIFSDDFFSVLSLLGCKCTTLQHKEMTLLPVVLAILSF